MDPRLRGGDIMGVEFAMTLYSIYEPPSTPGIPVAVGERFSWLALLLTPVFLLVHGLWMGLLLWVVLTVALVFADPILGSGVAFWLHVLVAAWFACAAPGLRRASLLGRGWHYAGERIAPSADLARLEAMR
jgi:hypothetical protein